MSKKPFIQTAATIFLPVTGWDLDTAINYAERLWARLNERGYGDPEKRGPREAEDWLGKLPADQRKAFERFWTAFGHKAGKQRAAMRWGLSAPDAVLRERIIEAARQEAQRTRNPGEVRKMAEGWLSERRWEDYTPAWASGRSEAQRSRQIRELRGEIAHLETLLGAPSNRGPDNPLVAQLKKKRADLAALLEAPDESA